MVAPRLRFVKSDKKARITATNCWYLVAFQLLGLDTLPEGVKAKVPVRGGTELVKAWKLGKSVKV